MRRQNDFYETAPWQTRALLAHQRIDGVVLEPCAGDQSIAKILSGESSRTVVTNDIDQTREADYHMDAADPELYRQVINRYGWVDWVVTNPAFAMPVCRDIVRQAVLHARKGVAMMLRISFREPTAKVNPRGSFLAQYPLSRVLTLPRYSYTQDGKSDSATTEWAIWIMDPRYNEGPPILSLYEADRRYTIPSD